MLNQMTQPGVERLLWAIALVIFATGLIVKYLTKPR